MTTPSEAHRDRMLELLADKVVTGLSDVDARELEGLLRDSGANAPTLESFERAAAACDLALEAGALEPMPEAVRVRVEQALAGQAADSSSAPPIIGRIGDEEAAPAISTNLRVASGWLAAAACLTLAVIAWWPQGAGDAAIERQRLINEADDEVLWAWAGLGEFAQRTVGGDVVWSNDEQDGYMRFTGIPANDPNVEQYQLWIFDPSQPEATPIDGGVFSVGASGEVVVRINENLITTGPTLFAVTIERPGGVVVSDRSRLVLIAKPPDQG